MLFADTEFTSESISPSSLVLDGGTWALRSCSGSSTTPCELGGLRCPSTCDARCSFSGDGREPLLFGEVHPSALSPEYPQHESIKKAWHGMA